VADRLIVFSLNFCVHPWPRPGFRQPEGSMNPSRQGGLPPKCKFLYYLITAGATRKPNSVSVSGYPETDNDHSS